MNTRFAYFMVIIGLLIAPVMQAQPTETVTYLAADETFKVDYAPQWAFTADAETGFYYLERADLHVTLYTPAVLEAYLIGDIVDPAILVGLVMALNDVTEISLDETLIAGRRAALYRYENTDEANSGLLAAIQFEDGTLGLLDAYTSGDDISLFTDELLAIAASFDIPPIPAPLTLVSYAAPWQDVVGELVASEFIATGGSLVFVQPNAFTAGTGLRFQGLAQQSTHQNVIVAGSLTYTPSPNPVDEECALVARFVDEANYLAVGQDSAGAVFAADRVTDAAEPQLYSANLAGGDSQHFILIARDNRLVVYLDGQLIMDDVRIAERQGSYGIVLSSNSSAGCAVNEMWAYLLPDVAEPGTCQISANGNVNQRSGAGVEFELVGQLAANTSTTAIGRATGTDGLVWWQVNDGSWVREDVVTVQGECASLPLTN